MDEKEKAVEIKTNTPPIKTGKLHGDPVAEVDF